MMEGYRVALVDRSRVSVRVSNDTHVGVVLRQQSPRVLIVGQQGPRGEPGPEYFLPVASGQSLGGIKVGDNLVIDENGVLSGLNSYVLPVANTTTLGGIKVGDNLTITANGVLSGTPGGVTSFNNRTGGVTLTEQDVADVADGRYVQTNATYEFGSVQVAAPVYLFDYYQFTGLEFSRSVYGTKYRQETQFVNFESALGVTENSKNPFLYSRSESIGDSINQTEFELDFLKTRFVTTRKNWDGTPIGQSDFLSGQSSFSMSVQEFSEQGFVWNFWNFDKYGLSVTTPIYCAVTANPSVSEVLTRGSADKLYVPLEKRN